METELRRVRAFIATLQQPALRAHFQRALDSACDLLSAAPPAPASAPLPVPSAPPGTALARTLHALSQASRLPALRAPQLTPCGALALSVHSFFLARGLTCTGAHDTPPGDAFAAPHRAVPPAAFLPAGWDADGGDSFHFRYQRHGAGRMGAATLQVHARAAESGALLVAARADRSLHGGGPAEAAVRLSLAEFAGGEACSAGSAPAAAQVAALCAALGGAEAGARFDDALERALLAPLLGEGSVAGPGGGAFGGEAGGSSPRGAGGSSPRGGGAHAGAPHHNPLAPGLPPPLTGRAPGDFDADLFPSVAGAVPGALPGWGGAPPGGGGEGGMTVGPGHPLLVGRYGPPGGGAPLLPPGVPAGARFDPFMPPDGGGLLPGGPLLGWPGAGRGVARIFPGEPNPDHAPVPGPNFGPGFGPM